MQKVFLALPVHDAKPTMATFHAIIHFMKEAAQRGIEVDFQAWVGDSIVSSSRNILLGLFYKSDCTDLICIDSDNSWEPGALIKLLEHPVDFVMAGYRTKIDQEKYAIHWIDINNIVSDENGLIEIAGGPFGIVRLTRNCVDKMVKAYDHLGYDDDHLAPGLPLWALFDNQLENRRYYGEDFTFCRRWRAIGGKVWLDPEIQTCHVGQKFYMGHVGQWLRAQSDPKPELTAERIREVFRDHNIESLLNQAAGMAA